MKSEANWIGEEDPLDRTEVGRQRLVTKIINVIVNSEVDVVHQICIFIWNLQEFFFSSWIHDVSNSHRSFLGEQSPE